MVKPENTTDDSPVSTRTSVSDPVDDQEPDVNLALLVTRYLRDCWLRRKLVFTILVVGISISLAIAFSHHNRYTSTTSILPPDSTSAYSNLINMMSSSGSAASLGSEVLGLDTPGELFVSILGSRNVLDSLVTHYNLAHYYRARQLADARAALVGDTKIDLDRKSGVISISVTLTDPVLTANVTRGYVTELNRVLTEDSTSSARRERIFLEGRVDEVKQQLDETSLALSKFSAKSGTIDMPSQAKSMVDEDMRLQAELITSRSQLAGLRETYSEDNPRVRAVEARNAELQRQIAGMGGLNQKTDASQNSKGSAYPSASELPALGLTYYDLERKVQVQQALWEALTRQYELAKVQEAEQTPAAHVLDAADIPERKSGPSRRLDVMVGGMLSLILACISVVVLNVWEGLDPQEEPKKLILEATSAVMESGRWYWSLPGMKIIHSWLS
jgi:uncharacterized protein involved in exopolysaccharide biosynthesis